MSSILDQLGSAQPVPIYAKVTGFNRMISLVFEGYSDDASMMELADLLSERNIDTVIFVSGIDAMEHPEIIRYITGLGIEVGNYTLTAEKQMQLNKAKKNARQFYLAQQAIIQAGMENPKYIRCNATEYNDEMLTLAGLCGLKAAIQPSVFLNHRSFSNEEQATNFARSVQRGSVVSIKIGQELDETEINTDPVQDERPAIDPQPTIDISDDQSPEESLKNDVSIVDLTRWILDACEIENHEIVSLQELQDAAAEGIPEQEVSEELLKKLDIGLYPKLTTQEPFGIKQSAQAADSYFNKSVFVGDSIMAGIESYVQNKRRTDPTYFGSAQFLAAGGLSVRNALWQVSSESRHPSYQGKRMLIEDAIGQMDVEKVYIMLGMNDILLSDIDTYLNNYQTLISLILEQSPGVTIYIQSITPGTKKEDLSPNNLQILQYDLALVEFCAKYGYQYVDVAHALRMEDGSLPLDMCSDVDEMGFHFTRKACEVWSDYIHTHTSDTM